ncbi:MAG: carboxylating nicotinate-nucleotide diphosphorylase [Gammaproteobacteria bacterium]|nr:carboxylating nicotinate-nucleotide diphosphorylase [Gammaproteobacteria bacterium]
MEAVREDVRRALREDVGAGDVSAGLLPRDAHAAAEVVAREECVLCGRDWFDEVFRACDGRISIRWRVAEGGTTTAGGPVCELEGPVRGLLSGERSALNFLQLLSAVATQARAMVKVLEGSRAILLDTRKTLPGLRRAQKYAVRVGGGSNHRMGLYDAVLLKENHIAAAGSVGEALRAASGAEADLPVMVEVQDLEEFGEALDAGARWVMLDNFSVDQMTEAVGERDRRALEVILEASGGIGPDNVAKVAATGVDRISVGALTKNVRACDFSMRITA